MNDLICRIFLFALKIFTQVVKAVAEATKVLGDVLVDVLDYAIDAVLGSGHPILLLVGVGLAAWWLLANKDKDKNPPVNQTGAKNAIA